MSFVYVKHDRSRAEFHYRSDEAEFATWAASPQSGASAALDILIPLSGGDATGGTAWPWEGEHGYAEYEGGVAGDAYFTCRCAELADGSAFDIVWRISERTRQLLLDAGAIT